MSHTTSPSSRALATAILFAIGLALHAPALLAQAAKAPAAGLQAELNALITAARAEGEVLIYSSEPEEVSKRITGAFTAKYGVRAGYVRGSSSPLIQRYSAEADANNIAGDLLLISGGAIAFAEDGIRKGWIESVSQAGLPVLKSGEFPAKFNRGNVVIVQVNPWLIAYNKDKIRGADVPKDWPDIVNPKFKGQALLFDPGSTEANYVFWGLLLDTYGESFFTQLRALQPRFTSGGIPASQQLAAGEGAFTTPATEASYLPLLAKGAPIGFVTPALTNGAEFHLILTNRAKAKHPAAARLFANYVLSQEGNMALSKDSGGYSVYDTTGLPAKYQFSTTAPVPPERRELINRLIGFKP